MVGSSAAVMLKGLVSTNIVKTLDYHMHHICAACIATDTKGRRRGMKPYHFSALLTLQGCWAPIFFKSK